MNARFDIQDRPGCIMVDEMRSLFERCINETKSFAENFALGRCFGVYIDSQTDLMWNGFAIGMRCAERIAKAAEGASQERGELLNALRELEGLAERYRPPGYPIPDAQKKARAAIAAATGSASHG
jgi:hypothetical protein